MAPPKIPSSSSAPKRKRTQSSSRGAATGGSRGGRQAARGGRSGGRSGGDGGSDLALIPSGSSSQPQGNATLLNRTQITALRSSIKVSNVRWGGSISKKNVDKAPVSVDLFISKFAEDWFNSSTMLNKKIARMKFPVISELMKHAFVPAAYDLFVEQGWDVLWNNPCFEYDDELIKLFYCNMWVENDIKKKPIALNSYIRGYHIRWTLNDISQMLGAKLDGFDSMATNPWDVSALGVTEDEVRNSLGIRVENNKLTTLDMPNDKRVASLLVSYCICSKEVKLASNLDFYITYRLARREQVNLGAVLVRCFIEAIQLSQKMLTHGSLIMKMLIDSGVPLNLFNFVTYSDTIGIASIERLEVMRSAMKKGKGKLGDSSDDSSEELFTRRSTPVGEAGRDEVEEGEEEEEDEEEEGEEGSGGFDESEWYVRMESRVASLEGRVEDINFQFSDQCRDQRMANEELRDENVALKGEVSKLKKAFGKLKGFIKKIVPDACFSSDED